MLKHGIERIISDFMCVMDEIRSVIEHSGKTFSELVFGQASERAPRYFQIIFLTFHKLLILDGKKVKDYKKLITKLSGIGSSISIPEGGRWAAEKRNDEVLKQSAVLKAAFTKLTEGDPTRERWLSQFEGILTTSKTEQSNYDFKLGFVKLDGKSAFDEENFTKKMKSLVAFANNAPGKRGYLIVGVADTKEDAERVKSLYNVDYVQFSGFNVVGLDYEADISSSNLDKYLQLLVEKIKGSGISEPLKSYILKNMKFVSYYDKHVLVLESCGQSDVSNYDGEYLFRSGPNNNRVNPADLVAFIKSYSS